MSNLKKISLFSLMILSLPAHVYSEVRERDCPYSCATENIERSVCRDWRNNDKCYIEDLRPDSDSRAQLGDKLNDSNSFDPDNERQVVMVDKTLSSGMTEKVKITARSIDKIDVVLKRVGSSVNTKLRAEIGESKSLGEQQVDQNVQHVLSFPVVNVARLGEDLNLTALDGDVYVESVHIIYRQ